MVKFQQSEEKLDNQWGSRQVVLVEKNISGKMIVYNMGNKL
jgi:hypothetical protein